MRDVLVAFFQVVSLVVFAYFLAINLVYLVTTLSAFPALLRYGRRLKAVEIRDLVTAVGAPPITVIAPAHDEEATCVDSVRALLALNYPEYEVLLVNDGSTDGTLARLIEAFALVPGARAAVSQIPTAAIRGLYRSRRHPNFLVIDKENGGKADALNAGLNHCRTPFFCATDADTLVERDALIRIIRPFLEDRETVAVGGSIRIANGCPVKSGVVVDVRLPKTLLGQFQVVEYLRSFLAGRLGWDAVNATLIIPGAFGLFRRSVVAELGGYRVDTVGEDMDLVVRLHRHCREKGIPYRVSFIADPIAWTECPESLATLMRQRDRWQRGLYESLTGNLRMLGNPRYGRIGLLAFPYQFFLEMLGVVVEFLGYAAFAIASAFGLVGYPHMAAFLLLAVLWGVALSVMAVALEELSYRRYSRFRDLLRLFGLAILENIGFRQLITCYRMKGFLAALFRVKGWGRMPREGFATARAR
ncbi:MAG: glycosyltransferase family 2 protein [Planctomycetes bacterium]|nr:glycosyltransferase family 2 protein [Planctomycetota bacterium]